MRFHTDILIVGGGLAGLTAALHLQKTAIQVILIEKQPYPGHKVCGEYISNEVLPYLKWLGADPEVLGPARIDRLQFSMLSGKGITTGLPLGGFGVSRFSLDNFLYKKFIANGGTVIQDTVKDILYKDEKFLIGTLGEKHISAKQVIGAYGKRSAIDLKLKRAFTKKRSPFLAIKGHYSGSFEDNLVALHNFKGGYCGVSKIEDQKINICYLADYATFRKYKNIPDYQQQVLFQNKQLRYIFENSTPLFESPLTISQLAFGAKENVVNHVLMIGDTAGLIHPLCGNGMGMAIHSAKICAELLVQFFSGTIKNRDTLEKLYTASWNKQFRSRLMMGNTLSAILQKERLADLVLSSLVHIPSLLPLIISKTHGKILTVKE
jgi:flavin-dependent dehydrogenase